MNVKGLQFSILHTGYLEMDKQIDLNLFNMGVVSNKTPNSVWSRTPSFALLIRHPDAGNILIDGGAREECWYGNGGRTKEMDSLMPFYAEEENRIDRQLAKCGLTAADLDVVVLTNMYWYRTGILPFLPGTKAGAGILVPRDDFAYAAVETTLANGDVGLRYRKADFRDKGIAFRYVEDEMLLAEGITLIPYVGNAPASLAVSIEAEENIYFFPFGAAPSKENMELPYTPITDAYDSLTFKKTAVQIERRVRELRAKMIFSSDLEEFEALQKAPYWYQ